MEENKLPRSEMRRWETVLALLWLPVHVLGLPLLLLLLFPQMSMANVNFWTYALGAAALTLSCLVFLRRDFDRLWERPLYILGQAALGYALLMLANYLLAVVLGPFLPQDNPNNMALMDMVKAERQRIIAISVILAPILEELIFRGGVFGLLRRWNRVLAYGACLLLFGLYHTWQFALSDPIYWLYLIQYLPAGFFLCRSYEKTECIWTSILLHILNNGMSLWLLQMVGG